MKKNALNKRFFREFKSDFGKYLVIFLLMIISIGEVSGFLVADESLIKAYNESFEKYNIEDGNFRTDTRLNKRQLKDIEALEIDVYENFSKDMDFKVYPSKKLRGENDKGIVRFRLFKNRADVNLPCIMKGELPKKSGEIAIDRLVADNNGITIGDKISINDENEVYYDIVGLIALSDYSTMFEDNNDTMFDSMKFGVAIVSDDEFNKYNKESLKNTYSFRYNRSPKNEKEEKEMAEKLLKELNKIVKLDDFVPRYSNQAIRFTGEDMGSDRAMISVFLYSIIIIIAFVFTITINNTISKESETIGTLLATGYTKNEITVHYMAMPLIVTLISALIGNIIGYTVLKDWNAYLYYCSYSLTKYVTIWSASAFFETTVIPIILMFLITFVSIRSKLSLSPLKFLNHDLSKRKHKKNALRLNKSIPFFTRYHLRVFFQNIGNYLMLFIGVLFAYFLLMFGMMFPKLLDKYQSDLCKSLLAKHQYLLQIPTDMTNDEHKLLELVKNIGFMRNIETQNPTAEKFSVHSLRTLESMGRQEDIIIYGIDENSKYVNVDKEDFIAVSKSMAEKFEIKIGDTVTLKEKYEDTSYSFKITAIMDYEGSLSIFMGKNQLNKMLDRADEYFSGYFSKTEITDIDERYLGTHIDLAALTKVSRQLIISMGSVMEIIKYFAIIIFVTVIYLLTKTMIEKNATSISLAKIIGYKNMEISMLYLGANTFIMIIYLIIGLPIIGDIMKIVMKAMLRQEMNGWLPLYIDKAVEIKMFIMGFFSYLAVMIFEYVRIGKIPMEEVLKNDE